MLYHYTSLSTLALILDSKAIKFNRLDLMDDPDESSYGYGESNMRLNSSSFASCWTADEMENISLWKMYADLRGIRIGLNEDMFITNHFKEGKSFLENPYFREDNLSVLASMNTVEKQPVEYNLKNDEHAIECYKKYAEPRGLDVLLHTNQIGLHKKKYWSFQKEMRFIIRGMSVNEAHAITDAPIKRTEFYIPLREDRIKEMEILLGPKTGYGEKLIAEALVFKSFKENHNIKIEQSKVKIK